MRCMDSLLIINPHHRGASPVPTWGGEDEGCSGHRDGAGRRDRRLGPGARIALQGRWWWPLGPHTGGTGRNWGRHMPSCTCLAGWWRSAWASPSAAARSATAIATALETSRRRSTGGCRWPEPHRGRPPARSLLSLYVVTEGADATLVDVEDAPAGAGPEVLPVQDRVREPPGGGRHDRLDELVIARAAAPGRTGCRDGPGRPAAPRCRFRHPAPQGPPWPDQCPRPPCRQQASRP